MENVFFFTVQIDKRDSYCASCLYILYLTKKLERHLKPLYYIYIRINNDIEKKENR